MLALSKMQFGLSLKIPKPHEDDDGSTNYTLLYMKLAAGATSYHRNGTPHHVTGGGFPDLWG